MKDCAIGLCVRNNERGLPAVLNNILILSETAVFKSITVFVFYDDSKDASLEILQTFSETHSEKIPFFIHINKEPLFSRRVENIARARNGILEMIRKKGGDRFGYFAMMDSNDYSCIGKIRPVVLQRMLERCDEWDAISFDRADGYYDQWATSYNPFMYSFFHFKNWNSVVTQMRADFFDRLERSRKECPDKLIYVFSAFNGFALYKSDVFLSLHYSSNIDPLLFPPRAISNQVAKVKSEILPTLEGDCEHRAFHLMAVKEKKAKIAISLEWLFDSAKSF
jgi:glycosyltransferase involved in cell wall biosynthesis